MKISWAGVLLVGFFASTGLSQNARPVQVIVPAAHPVYLAASPALNPGPGKTIRYNIPRVTVRRLSSVVVPDAGGLSGYVPENVRDLHDSLARFQQQQQQRSNSSAVVDSRAPGHLSALHGAAAPDLQLQSQRYDARYSNTEVRQMQLALNRLGYYRGPADGVFGSSTQTAVLAYQVQNAQPATGVLSTQLLSSLGIIRKSGD